MAHHAEAGSGGVGAERALGTETAGAVADRGRRGAGSRIAGTSLESQDAGRGEAAGGGTLPKAKTGQVVARLRAHAGSRRAGRTARDPGEPGDAAPVADRG